MKERIENNWVLEVLSFWLGTNGENDLENQAMWWKKDPKLDHHIKEKFEPLLQRLIKEDLQHFLSHPQTCLAYIIVLDQFSRNIYRGHSQAFAYDQQALAASLQGQAMGLDRRLSLVERWFFYMPMMHAENLEIQKLSLRSYAQLALEAPINLKKEFKNAYDFAVRHAEIIEQFGHFPHRNEILGRRSTDEEIEFLNHPNSSF